MPKQRKAKKTKYVGKAITPETMRRDSAELEAKIKKMEGGEQFLKFFKAIISPNNPDPSQDSKS